jgi:hypothetical protein
MPKRRRRRRRQTGALSIVRQARAAAKAALDSLRNEIRETAARLAKLVLEEKSFRLELFGGGKRGNAPGPGRGRGRPAGRRGRPRKTAARRKTPLAEKYYAKLPNTFTLEDVRKLAGRKAGISLAQWSRAKRIRKSAKGYQKTAA